MDCRFVLWAFILRWKRVVLLTIIAWVAHRYGQLYLHCSLIYFWVPFQLFLHSDQPLSEGEIIPFSGVCQSGGGCIIHAGGGWWLHALTDRLLWCATDDDQRQHHRRASFSALASANSFVYLHQRSNITLTHLHVSNCRVRQLQFSGILSLGFVGNGVITVMINSPWQAERWCR